MRKARRPAATALALALALQLGAAVPAVAADSSFRYGDMTSVAVSPDSATLSAALQAEGYNDAGRVALFTCNSDGTLTLKGLVETGVQPDMVTFADNDTVLTADEGEPREGYGAGIADPKGSVTVVDVAALTSEVVGFDAFDTRRDELAASGVVLKKGGPLRRPGAGVHRRLRRQGLYHPPGEQRHRRAGSGFPDL